MDTRQRICAGLLLGFLAAALLLPHIDDTTLAFLPPLLLPPLLAVIAARLRFSLPPALVRALAITLGAATLTLCWAHAETLARQATFRAERDHLLGESAFLAAVAAVSSPELVAPASAPPAATDDDTYEAPWAHDIERIEHIGPWPTAGGAPLPLTFRWRATPAPVDTQHDAHSERREERATASGWPKARASRGHCAPGVQRFTRDAATVSALVDLPHRQMHLRVPPLGPHIWLIALAFAAALLLTHRTALGRLLVGATLLTGLTWTRAPVTLDADYESQLTLAAQDLLSARTVDPTTLTPCPAPPDVRFVVEPGGVRTDVSRHQERKWLILMSFLGASLALGAVLGLLIHGVERPRRV